MTKIKKIQTIQMSNNLLPTNPIQRMPLNVAGGFLKLLSLIFFFFFNDTATTEIYTLSLHDALPISQPSPDNPSGTSQCWFNWLRMGDRKSTRLNSSHLGISYAVFCLKKKKNQYNHTPKNKQSINHNQNHNVKITH